MFKKLNLGELEPSKMYVQLANKSIVHPRGMIENILVNIDEFIYSVDFMIIAVKANVNIPLIIGQPFLVASKAIIDVHGWILNRRVKIKHVKIIVTRIENFANNKSIEALNGQDNNASSFIVQEMQVR